MIFILSKLQHKKLKLYFLCGHGLQFRCRDYLLSIYDKSVQETLSQKELDELLKFVPDDL